jgi:hypothetical protein
MRQTHEAMLELNVRKKASCSRAEQELLRRGMVGSMTKHKTASDLFQAVELAMDQETRLSLWRLVSAGAI